MKKWLFLTLAIVIALLPAMVVAAPANQDMEGRDYEVKAGDTLGQIGLQFGVPYLEIVSATNAAGDPYAFIEDPDLIEIGWLFLIPGEAMPYPDIESPTYPDAQPGGKLVYALWQDLSDPLDPNLACLQVTAQIVGPIFDPLVYVRPEEPFTYYPGLATDWEISSDLKTYTFYLRDDVTFHDGTPFNAEAAKYNFDWQVAGNPVCNTPVVMGPYESSEVIDEYTIQVNFSEPNGAFLAELAQVWVAMQSPTAKEKWGDEYQFHLSGTGPFMLKEYVPNDHVTVVRNPDYAWAPPIFHQGTAYLDEIEFRIITEDGTRVGGLDAGDLLMIDGVPAVDFARFEANPDFQTFTWVGNGLGWSLQANMELFPTNIEAVRQAIHFGTDRVMIADTIFKGTHLPAYQLAPPGFLGYSAENDVNITDVEKAKKILEDAGWVDSDGDGIREKDGQRLTQVLPYPVGFQMDELAAVLQAQWRELGIETNIETAAFSALFPKGMAGELNYWIGFFWWPDPGLNFLWFGSASTKGACCNFSQLKSDELDQLIADGIATINIDERQAIYEETNYLALNKYYGMIPLFHKLYVGAAVSNLKGITHDYTGYPRFNDMYFVTE